MDMDLLVTCTWLVLWPNHGLVVTNSGIEFGIVLYPICGVIVWTILWASLMPQLVMRIKLSLLEIE